MAGTQLFYRTIEAPAEHDRARPRVIGEIAAWSCSRRLRRGTGSSQPVEVQMDQEILENPVTGELIRVLESTPASFKAQYSLRPHSEIPGEHLHPYKEQRISVLSGEMHLRIDGVHRIVSAGQAAIVPRGARHFQWNPCDAEAVVIEEVCPAGRMHDFFKVLFGLARDGRTDRQGYPPLLLSAALFAQFKDSILPAPYGLRLLFALLGPIALSLGYRRQIEAYLQVAPRS